MNHFIASVALAALIGPFAGPVVVFAEENPDALLAISDDQALSDEERFAAAKDGLVRALGLALEKVEELTVSLEGRSFESGSREDELKSAFLENLSTYRTYYSEQLVIAEPLDTVEEVQALAQNIKDYRNTTYTPGVEEIVQFILVFYSEDVIGVATERFDNITADIGKLKSLGLIEEGAFTGEVERIDALLSEARDLQSQAKNSVLIEESDTATLPAEPADTTSPESTDNPDGDPSTETPLEKSLTNVKLVYEIFLTISREVKETLGIE